MHVGPGRDRRHPTIIWITLTWSRRWRPCPTRRLQLPPFILRQALLPLDNLRAAYVAHARRELVRHLFGVVLDVPSDAIA